VIIKGASRRNVKFWAKHLTDTKKNDRAEMVDKRGLLSENLTDMLHEIQDNAHLTKCKNAMYIASFSPAIGEKLTEVDWERAYEIFEKQRGIPEGQRRIVYEHEKEGRTHRHVVWDRIDAEKMKAFPDAHDWKICAVASQEITQELGLQHTPGILFREPGAPRPERNPKSWEMFRGMESQIDVQELAADVQALHRQSKTGQQFKAALEAHGFELATGKRGLLILDNAGKEHSLARRCGITQKEINAFMRDVDREALPTLDQAKERYQDRKLAGLEADRATVADEIKWHEALEQAAIAKEEKERRFVEPQPEGETRAGQQQPQPPPPAPAPPLGRTAGEIRLAHSRSDSAPSFAAALAEKGIALAITTKEDAEKSRIAAAAAQEKGSYAPVYREGEIVAVNDRATVYRLNESTTGSKFADMQRYLRNGLDTSTLRSIEATKEMMYDRAAERGGRGFSNISRPGMHEQDILDRAERMTIANETAASTRERQRLVLDRAERRTMENERAQGPRNTRDS